MFVKKTLQNYCRCAYPFGWLFSFFKPHFPPMEILVTGTLSCASWTAKLLLRILPIWVAFQLFRTSFSPTGDL